MMKGVGTLLNEFDLSTIQRPTGPVEIKDHNFIASYNWKDTDEPVIFVPGSPAKWNPPSLPYQVPKDDGQAFIDQNSHRSPSACFDPFFKALLTMHPGFSMKAIGLTTDRNSLRKLLQLVSGKVPQSWRIDVDIVDDTMFFTRWEQSQVQIITGARDSGYGHEFEKAFLTYDPNLQDSSGHHRIVHYNLGGIECLVRFEVDGYIVDDSVVDGATSVGNTEKNIPIVGELSQALSGFHIQKSTKPSALPSAHEVKVIERGNLVDDSTILELKSRSAHLKILDSIAQLWISQTRHLFIGRHKEGLVEVDPERLDMEEHFQSWEDRNQDRLMTLVGLITKIKEITKGVEGGKCVLVCEKEEKPRTLRMYKRARKGFFLPEGVRETCWGTAD
ncbi:hypothetical protein BDV97DRAFT_394602 [Delphinella strobiligena]|nr:hypothetical protein BDV97DRAFT_394602 [Delphinella strobiligena]